MAVEVKFENNLIKVQQQMGTNVRRALTALGTEAVALITGGMYTLYGKPIMDTGELIRDVNYEVHPEDHAVTVGNRLGYSVFVHEGTSKMKGRPYISDSLSGHYAQERMKQVAEAYLKQGFE